MESVVWGWITLVFMIEALLMRGTIRFQRSFLQQREPTAQGGFTPRVSLIVPFKGLDQGMDENIHAFLSQEPKPDEVFFVAHSKDDPSFFILKKYKDKATILVRNPRWNDCSFKIASQLTALGHASSEVLAFADSDVRPHKDWLHQLVQPLQSPEMGAATSCPWYVPPDTAVASSLQAAWNSSAGLSLTRTKHNFIRGCSFAIRRERFYSLGMKEIWTQELSDDASLTLALKRNKIPIAFVPRAIVPLVESFSLEKFQELSTRWVKIVRHYSRKTIRLAGLIYGFYTFTFLTGLATLAVGLVNPVYLVPGVLLLVPQLLALYRAAVRFSTIEQLLPSWREQMKQTKKSVLLLEFMVKFFILSNIIKARRMKSIHWRGRAYRLD